MAGAVDDSTINIVLVIIIIIIIIQTENKDACINSPEAESAKLQACDELIRA